MGWCTCCVVDADAVVPSWSVEKQLSFAAVVCVLTFGLHHEVLCDVLSVVLSWPVGFVVCMRAFVLGYEFLSVVLSWSSGRQPFS